MFACRLRLDDLVELLREIRHVAIVIVSPAHVNQLSGLVLDRFHDLRMTMAGRTNGDACVAIQEDVPINILDPDTAGTFGYQFEGRAQNKRVNVFVVSFDNLLSILALAKQF